MRVTAVALIAVVGLAGSGLQSAASAALQQTLDSNWRGAYDILVTAPTNQQSSDGLLAPNSLSNGTEKLSLSQWRSVQSLSGIDVAAPIGDVVVPALKLSNVTVSVPPELMESGQPEAYRATIIYTTNDGISDRFVSSQTANVVISGSSDAAIAPTEVSGQPPVSPKGGVWTIGNGTVGSSDGSPSFMIGAAPQTTTHITLVDPQSEQKLLGASGTFLSPLIDLHAGAKTSISDITDWASHHDSPFALHLQQSAPPADDTASFAPILVSPEGAADLTAHLTVENYGAATTNPEYDGFNSPFLLPASLSAGQSGHVIGTTDSNVNAVLNPFLQEPAIVPWPGATTHLESAPDSLLIIQANGTSTAPHYIRSNGKLSVQPYGYRVPVLDYTSGPASLFALEPSGMTPGSEAAYSDITFSSANEVGTTVIPVGAIPTNVSKTLQTDANFVPLGAYQALDTTVVGGPNNGDTVRPGISGMGLVGPRTVAIAAIQSAELWGQITPIDAIRVRVAGITSYNKTAETKVVNVAQSIRALGLDATIVAGSSPTDVTVNVDGYAFGTMDETAEQTVAPLGAVTQRWSELGAAARADTAISLASTLVLTLALTSVALLLGAVQFMSVPRRQGQAAVMRELGFTRGRVRRWMLAEEIPALGVVVVAGCVGAFASGFSTSSSVALLASALIVAVSSAAAVMFGTSRRRQRLSHSASSRLRGRSISTFGLRQTVVHYPAALVNLFAIAVVGLSASSLMFVVLQGDAGAGDSALAGSAFASTLVPQLVLGTVGIVSGLILAIIGRRVDLARRSPQWATMRAMGWTLPQLRQSQRVEYVAVAIPAVLIVAVVSFLSAILLGSTRPLLLTIVGSAASVVVSLLVLFANRKVRTL